MSFVYDYGGKIAEFKGGKWKGTLDSPQAIQALTRLKRIVRSYSRANKTGDEANPAQALVFGKGKVGSFIGNGWEWGYALNKDTGNPALEDKIGAYPMPSRTPGKYMPTFLGGSDLAIPVTSKNRQLAIDWIKEFTGTDLMRYMATVGKVLPNTTSLANVHKTNKQVAPFARAASSSWFVPAAENWVNVENKRIIRNMLVRIFSGRGSVAAEAKKASQADHRGAEPEQLSLPPARARLAHVSHAPCCPRDNRRRAGRPPGSAASSSRRPDRPRRRPVPAAGAGRRGHRRGARLSALPARLALASSSTACSS